MRAIKIREMTGKWTHGDTREQYTRLCQGFWQWLILNSNIVLATVQCLRYINTHDVSAGAVQSKILHVFNFHL
jgi:hypothetical protein